MATDEDMHSTAVFVLDGVGNIPLWSDFTSPGHLTSSLHSSSSIVRLEACYLYLSKQLLDGPLATVGSLDTSGCSYPVSGWRTGRIARWRGQEQSDDTACGNDHTRR